MNKGWKKKWEYAMYKGDELLAFGTSDQICKQMNINKQTFLYYRTKAYKDRIKNRKAKNYRYVIRIDKN